MNLDGECSGLSRAETNAAVGPHLCSQILLLSLILYFLLFFPSPGVSFNSVYTQIWRVLLHLAADPFPEVSDLAMKVLNSIAYKVCCVSAPIPWRSRNLDPFSGRLSMSCNVLFPLAEG